MLEASPDIKIRMNINTLEDAFVKIGKEEEKYFL